MNQRCSILVRCIIGVAISVSVSSQSWANPPFYEGKTIRYVISMGPGGGFDTYGRLLARHMGRHIPGNQRFIVQNIPGAGSLVAANLIFQEQPGDGLTMVMLHFAAITQAIVGHPQAKFDPLKYNWIGDPSIGGLPQVIWMRSDLPIHSMADFRNAEKPWRLGSTGVGIGSAISAEFLKEIGFPITLVLGYKSSADVMLALERKELDGYSISQATMEQVFHRYIDSKLVRPLLSLGREPRLPPLPGAATLDDLKLSSKERELADVFTASQALLRVHAVPPGTPQDRVQMLREAFVKTLNDKRLLEEAAKMKIMVSPTSGEQVTKIVNQLRQVSPDTLEQFKTLLSVK
jgi:tripartite-type tricarboxylate transporter receptor subunit TctC